MRYVASHDTTHTRLDESLDVFGPVSDQTTGLHIGQVVALRPGRAVRRSVDAAVVAFIHGRARAGTEVHAVMIDVHVPVRATVAAAAVRAHIDAELVRSGDGRTIGEPPLVREGQITESGAIKDGSEKGGVSVVYVRRSHEGPRDVLLRDVGESDPGGRSVLLRADDPVEVAAHRNRALPDAARRVVPGQPDTPRLVPLEIVIEAGEDQESEEEEQSMESKLSEALEEIERLKKSIGEKELEVAASEESSASLSEAAAALSARVDTLESLIEGSPTILAAKSTDDYVPSESSRAPIISEYAKQNKISEFSATLRLGKERPELFKI